MADAALIDARAPPGACPTVAGIEHTRRGAQSETD